MIAGLIPIINLWVLAFGSSACLLFILTSHWWRDPAGKHLFVFLFVETLWYFSIWYATTFPEHYTPHVQDAQAVVWVGMGVVTVWRLGLMIWFRFRKGPDEQASSRDESTVQPNRPTPR